jgi:16S rRNA (cytidine1402-2'-O)-methyltransferase
LSGRLFICPTPIGNLEDITLRAIRTLREADLIVAEDSRHSRVLLERYNIRTPFTTSYYQGVERERVGGIIKLLEEGKDIALISDAGTPLIADPGYPLVREALARGIEVVALPGPTALIPALILSGFPTNAFIFDGSPPRKEKQRREYFQSLRGERRTVVLYESPHRILKTLELIAEALPERKVALCRELTKLHEEVLRGKPAEVLEILKKRAQVKGELVLVIRGALAPQAYLSATEEAA